MEKIPSVREFMSKGIIFVRPDTDIYLAINLLLDHKISGAPVVEVNDQSKTLLGMLSAKDCMSILVNGAFYDLPAGKVSDYMSTKLVTVDPGKDVFAVAEIFLRHHFRRVPVVENGVLIGIVSRGDVLKASRRLWQNQHAPNAPDPGYLTDSIRAKLGDDGITHLHKKLG